MTPTEACGAKTKAGTPCRLAPMPNGRCYRHGGATPQGPDLPQFIHGRYSKAMPRYLRARIDTVESDEELHDLSGELALLDSVIADLMAQWNPDDDEGQLSAAQRADLTPLLELRRKLVDSSTLRLSRLGMAMTIREAEAFAAGVIGVVERFLPRDDPRRIQIAQGVGALFEPLGDGRALTDRDRNA